MIEWSSKVRDYHGAKKKTPWSKCDCVSKKKLRPNPTGLHSITGVWLQMVVQATFIMFTKSDELIHPWPQNTRFLLNIYPMPQKLRVGSAALSIVCVWSDCVCASLAGLCDPLTTILLFYFCQNICQRNLGAHPYSRGSIFSSNRKSVYSVCKLVVCVWLLGDRGCYRLLNYCTVFCVLPCVSVWFCAVIT